MDAFALKPEDQSLGSRTRMRIQCRYPLNCWWVAAGSDEIKDEPLSRWLLGERVVLFRTGDAAIVALEDRCAHRWAPLSQGKLVGGEIACPYHGFRYNARGICTHIPTQSHIPAMLRVRSYPVREHGPFVWIWMGDSTRADPALLPSILWPSDPPYSLQSCGYMEVNCSYIAVQENLMDKSHADYLHAPDRDWLQPAFTFSPNEIRATDRGVVIAVRDTQYSGRLESTTIAEGERFNVSETSTFTAPGSWFNESRIDHIGDANKAADRYTRYGLHCTTPISPTSCHWWWAYIQNSRHNTSKHFHEAMTRVLQQDKDILEAIQLTVDRDNRGENVPEVAVKADQALGQIRRAFKRLLDEESQESPCSESNRDF